MFENYTFAVGERVAHTEHCRPWNDHCIPLGKWMWRRNGDNVETAQKPTLVVQARDEVRQKGCL